MVGSARDHDRPNNAPVPTTLILKRNLAALSGRSVETAEAILAAEPAAIEPTAGG